MGDDPSHQYMRAVGVEYVAPSWIYRCVEEFELLVAPDPIPAMLASK